MFQISIYGIMEYLTYYKILRILADNKEYKFLMHLRTGLLSRKKTRWIEGLYSQKSLVKKGLTALEILSRSRKQ